MDDEPHSEHGRRLVMLLADNDGGVKPLTKDELDAIRFYLDRPHHWRGFSSNTKAEIRGLIERLHEVAKGTP